MTNAFQGTGVLKRLLKDAYWNLYGGIVKNPPLPSQVRSILFICKGNICRSPFAEQIAKKQVDYSKSFEFSSAGIHVGEPKTPPQEAILSAKGFGIDLSDHKSRSINYSMMESFDMITAMEVWQYKYMKKLFLEFGNKMYLLPLFDNSDIVSMNAYHKYNIQDPYARKIDHFNICFHRIDTCISRLISLIRIN